VSSSLSIIAIVANSKGATYIDHTETDINKNPSGAETKTTGS